MKANIWVFIALAVLGLAGGLLMGDSLMDNAKNNGNGRAGHPPEPAPSPTPSLNGFGALLPGVTAQHKIDWNVGRTQFQTPETFEDGLGPIFNNTSCFACHTSPDVNGKPVVGGGGAVTETRFMTSAGVFDLLHQSATSPDVQDSVPFDAVLSAHRISVPLFGAGLVEAIPDSAIIANENGIPGQLHQKIADGVGGRAAILADPVTLRIAGGTFLDGVTNLVGRFGWKCQQASLLAFAGDAQINELGETNRFFGTDFAPHLHGTEPPNQVALIAAEPPGITPTTLQDTPVDPTQPESVNNKDDLSRYHDFMRFNAPPPPVTPLSDSAQNGQKVFARINCVACHKPMMQTGLVVDEPQLSFQNVNLYSDLLLHNMGDLADGIAQGDAGPQEMRTSPLWGLRGRGPFLHDGRAATIQQAIEAHDAVGAESQKIGQRFKQLPPDQQQDLIDFLNSI